MDVLNFKGNLVKVYKQGRIVVCIFFGVDAFSLHNTTLFSDTYSYLRPYAANPSAYCPLYKSESDNYIASVDITTAGVILIYCKNTLTTRSALGDTGHKLYGSMAWFTES